MKIRENKLKIVYEMRFAWPYPSPMNENESVNDVDIYPTPLWWATEHNK